MNTVVAFPKADLDQVFDEVTNAQMDVDDKTSARQDAEQKAAAVKGLTTAAQNALKNAEANLQLLELANPTQPLLRRLLMEAPGTYHHSIMVGNLAEWVDGCQPAPGPNADCYLAGGSYGASTADCSTSYPWTFGSTDFDYGIRCCAD